MMRAVSEGDLMQGKVNTVLSCAIESVNELLPEDNQLSKNRETVLLGQNGELDSMGFVNLVASVEDQLERQFGVRVSLVDEVMKVDGELTLGGLSEILERIVRKYIT